MPLICHTSLTTGRNCSRSRSVRPILLEMLLQRIGSDKFARICPTPLSLLQQDKVISLFRMLRQFGEIEVVFDTVNKKGMAMMQKKYMKQVGHADVQMFFYVDSAVNLAGKIGGGLMDMTEEPYYRYIPKNGLKLSTKVSMAVSDRFCMVKMICLNL